MGPPTTTVGSRGKLNSPRSREGLEWTPTRRRGHRFVSFLESGTHSDRRQGDGGRRRDHTVRETKVRGNLKVGSFVLSVDAGLESLGLVTEDEKGKVYFKLYSEQKN